MKPGRTLLIVILLITGLVAVNYLASSLPLRIDASADNLYTLSPGSRAIIAKLEEPVRMDFYFSATAASLRVSDKNYAARVEEMLRQYVRAARGRIELQVINPKRDTPAEEAAAAAGLAGQPMPTGETVYLGLVVTHADKREVIPYFAPQREPFLEYDLSRAIHAVQLFDRRKLGLITGLALRGMPDFMAMQMGREPDPDQLIVTEWERSFEIVRIDSTASELPAGLDALAVVHPLSLPDKLQYAIDQFLLAGNPVFVAVDPSSRSMLNRSPQSPGMMGASSANSTSDLPTLLSGWGLAYDPGKVAGDLENATTVSMGAGRTARLSPWISLPRSALSHDFLPTAQLDSLLFVEPGSLAPKDGAAGLSFQPLIQTSKQAGLVDAFLLQVGQPDQVSNQLTVTGQKTLAALVQGTFKSAFPHGAPAETATDPAPGAAAPPKVPAPHLGESAKPGRLVIFADADWLMDDYSVRRMNFMGTPMAEPLNDNLALGSSVVEFIAGSEDLVSIRGKGSSTRPFSVVRRMEAEAQRRYQEQLSTLEARINDVQSKLTELQGKKTDGGRLVASPEIAKAIEDFQRQEAAMRGERRQIRAALRADIERLEYSLLVANLAAPIALVLGFGFWFHRRRFKDA